jgi:hypothetical protein
MALAAGWATCRNRSKETSRRAGLVEGRAFDERSANETANAQALKPQPAGSTGAPLQRRIVGLQRTAGNRAVSRLLARPGGRTLSRWTKLGTVSWDVKWGDKLYHGATVHAWAGSKSEWSSVLGNLDDEDEYDENLKGFLWVANDPGFVAGARKNHPSASQPGFHDFYHNYRSTIVRAPTVAERLAFLEALYEKGEALDLWHGGAMEGGPWIIQADSDIATFIRQNQGIYLEARARAGHAIPSDHIKAVADQGGKQATMAIILNAGASAFKGVDLIAAGAGHGDQLVQNAGHAIRYALEAHDARVAFEKKLVGFIFDTVWGVIPGGGTLSSVAKDVLKTGLKEGLDAAMTQDAPKKQAEAILLKFVKSCNDLKASGELDDVRSRLAITTFEAAMR